MIVFARRERCRHSQSLYLDADLIRTWGRACPQPLPRFDRQRDARAAAPDSRADPGRGRATRRPRQLPARRHRSTSAGYGAFPRWDGARPAPCSARDPLRAPAREGSPRRRRSSRRAARCCSVAHAASPSGTTCRPVPASSRNASPLACGTGVSCPSGSEPVEGLRGRAMRMASRRACRACDGGISFSSFPRGFAGDQADRPMRTACPPSSRPIGHDRVKSAAGLQAGRPLDLLEPLALPARRLPVEAAARNSSDASGRPRRAQDRLPVGHVERHDPGFGGRRRVRAVSAVSTSSASRRLCGELEDGFVGDPDPCEPASSATVRRVFPTGPTP